MVLCFFFFPWMCSGGRRVYVFVFFRVLSLSLFPQLDQTLTRHTPSTHPAITLKKGEGSHALQKTPHATLPCAMTRQDKVASSPSTYKYGEAEKKGGGRKKRGKEKRKKRKERETGGESKRKGREEHKHKDRGLRENKREIFENQEDVVGGEKVLRERERLFENQRELKT
jgi:hypothetical protein